MSDYALRRQVAQLATELARTQAQVRTLRRGARRPQLGHSSIDSGSLDVVDSETGQVRLRLGYQPDGTVGVVPEGGDPHPAPATPVVEPIPSGLSVSWNGALSGLDTLPADFDHVNVHVSLADGFTPDGATFVGTITRSGGALQVAPLEVGETYYVCLVPVGTGGVQGAPSPQASGVPTGVTDIEPGSITETEIADDAITSPKISANAVQALHIAAEQIEAGHIQAAAVTAAKLEAMLVLGTRIIAGDPAGARVEMDENGLRGYDAGDVLIFAIQDGNAVFSGSVTGSEITGSRFSLEDSEFGGGIYIEHPTDSVPRLLIYTGSDTGPGLLAQGASLELRSAIFGSSKPAIKSRAYAATAVHTVETSAAVNAARVRIRADEDSAHFEISPPGAGSGGTIYGYVKSTGAPAIGYTSPAYGVYPTQSSQIELEGSHGGRAASQATYWADQHIVMRGAATLASDGVWALDDMVSLLSNRHAPVRGALAAPLTGYSTGTNFYDFPSGTFAPFTFKTGWSGRAKVEIMMCGLNNNSDASSIALGFRLSGGSTVPADLKRAAYVRSAGAGFGSSQSAYFSDTLNLVGNATYTLTPMYRITSGSVAFFDTALANHIIVTPLT